MESETTEINYWQRARINLNLAKSRQLRVHAEKRPLGRCRFMHMPRRRRFRDWDKITSGCTRSSFVAHKHPLTTIQSKSPLPFTNHPDWDLPILIHCHCSPPPPSPRLHRRHKHRGRVYIRTDYMRKRPRLLPLRPSRMRVFLFCR